LLDILNGYGVAVGSPNEPQALMAIEFYKAIVGAGNDPRTANVEVTGHSLGGGLAGLVGALYGKTSLIFDHMPFQLAAWATYFQSTNPWPLTNTALRDLVYGAETPWREDISGLRSIYIPAASVRPYSNWLDSIRPDQGALAETLYDLPPDTPLQQTLNNALGQRHSAGLLVIRMFGDGPAISQDWGVVAKHFMPALFDEELAGLTGATAFVGLNNSSAGVLRDALAYSAIDEGVRVFGDTGIRALFDDANDLGAALKLGNLSTILSDSAESLSRIFVQFAGQLAIRKVLQSDHPDAIEGVISLSPDQKTLAVDFSDSLWKLEGANPSEIRGREELINDVFSQAKLFGPAPQYRATGSAGQAMKFLWNTTDTKVIDRVAFATTNEAVNTQLPERSDVSSIALPSGLEPVSIYVFGDGNDTIVGSNNTASGLEKHDFIVGGGGDDTLIAGSGRGNDLLAGGKGNDTLVGGEWRDVLLGGEGHDIALYNVTSSRSFASLIVRGTPDRAIGGLEIQNTGSAEDIDRVAEIEKVLLTHNSDYVRVEPITKSISGTATLIDGDASSAVGRHPGSPGDKLDFGLSNESVYLGSARNGLLDLTSPPPPSVVEQFQGYSPLLQAGQLIMNLFVPSGAASSGEGLTDPTGLRFTNFEHVIGSGHDDTLNLWQLNPGGALSAADQSTYDTLRATKIPFSLGPTGVAGATNALIAAAGAIAQNQLDVLIEGGAGNDILVGTDTGKNRLYGGSGIDTLVGGGYTSELYGGEGTDLLIGNGMQSKLWGDAGADIFSLSHHTFVQDAGYDDYAMWGPLRLTGAIQQFWQEGQWAYWAPMTSLMSVAPLPFLNSFGQVFGAGMLLLDAIAMTTVRYGMTSDSQLIVQMARGRAGQAVVEGYKVDVDTGAATANIVVAGSRVSTGKMSLQELKETLNTVLKSGFGICFLGTDPLVLDLDGDGLELMRADASQVYFDIDNDGFAEKTAWVKGDDGLLARDLNGNGTIDNIGELFGDATTPGFSALAALDANSDGKISAADAAFSTLRVWRDLDGDGVSDAGELATLAEAGITEIGVTAGAPSTSMIRGNLIRNEATFKRADGTSSAIADVMLDGNQSDSRYLGDATVSSAAAALPNLKGYGNVVDLAVAMTDDATLLGLVSAFATLPPATTLDAMKAAADDILFRWAGVHGVAPTPMGGGVFDQQKLAFLEAYAGYQLTPRIGGGAPFEGNLDELTAMWDKVLGDLTARLAVQGPLETMLAAPAYDAANDLFLATSATTLADSYRNAIQQLSADPATAAPQWGSHWGPLLAGYTKALVRADGITARADYAVQSLVRALDGITAPLSLAQLVGGLGFENVHVGTAGADTLGRVGSGLNVYVGEGGNDTITGGYGQDVYVYGRDFGEDTITDQEGAMEMGDRIRFATLTANDVTMRRVGNDLVITVNGTTDKITIVGQFATPVAAWSGMQMSPDWGVEEIQFADGQIYDAVDVAARVGLGTDASETIDGSGSQDVIEGLKGDDLLRGGENGDSYFYTRGDGADTIQDVTNNPLLNAADTLYLLGMLQSDLRVARDGSSDDVTLSFSWGGADSIVLDDQFAYTVLGYETKVSTNTRIEQIFFDHGSGMSWIDLQQLTIATYTTGGDDATYGFGTSDQFAASAGNDLLVGFDGGDTYRFGIGSGQDRIEDRSRYPEDFAFASFIGYAWGYDDVVEFGEGITLADVEFSRTGETPDLLITIDGHPDSLTINNQFFGQKLDLFDFLGIAWFDRVETFKFADGTTLTWEDVLLDVTTGGIADDVLYGAYYQDTLDGKEGSDFLSGGNDSDLYLFGRGYGSDTIEDNQDNPLTLSIDTLKFGADIAVGDITFARDGATLDLLVSINGTTDQVRLKNQYYVLETGVFGAQPFDRVDRFEWADGTVKTWAQVSQQVIDAMKTAGDDTILGSHEADRIDGGAGNDLLKGWNGNDTYVFGRGYGQDTIEDGRSDLMSGAVDTLEFAADVLAADVDVLRGAGDDIAIRIRDTGETVTLKSQDDPSLIKLGTIETVRFTGGIVWNEAELRQRAILSQESAGNDTVRGFHEADVIVGGAGNDILLGAEGDDIYRFGPGFGTDRIEEVAAVSTEGGADTVEFLAGIAPQDVALSRPAGTDDLVLTVGASNITIKDQFRLTPAFGMQNDIERVTFADGTVWTDEAIRSRLLEQAKSGGSDSIHGFAGADVLDGGAGSDQLLGGAGGDIYRFGFGSGHDVIDETVAMLPLVPGADSVEFAAGLVRSDVTFSRVGNDLVASLTGGNDTLTIKDHFATSYALGNPKIEYFRFSNNWLVTAAEAEVNAPGSDASNNQTFNGTTGADILDGGSGNDTLIGGSGSDTYVFGRGYGADVVDDRNADSSPMGTSTDIVAFAAGVVAEDILLSYVGNDLVMTVSGTSDVLTIKDQFAPPALSFRPNAIEEIVFADGTVWTEAELSGKVLAAQQTNGNDAVRGFFTDDVLLAGAGNDTLSGRDGSDTYRFKRGFGQDVIAETVDDVLRTENDAIEFLDISSTEAVLSRVAGTDDLLIKIGAETVRVQGQFTPYNYNPSRTDVEAIRFADGITLSERDVREQLIAQARTSGNDTIEGYFTDDVIDGGAGNDVLRGGDGSDTYLFGRGSGQDTIEEGLQYHVFLQTPDTVRFADDVTPSDVTFTRVGNNLVAAINGTTDTITTKDHYAPGTYVYSRMEYFKFADGTTIDAAMAEALAVQQQSTAGNDTVRGSNGADLIDPGAGTDTAIGGTGGDSYVFGRGSGEDTIDEQGDTASGVDDFVRFGAGVTGDDLRLSRSGDDVVIAIAGTSDRLTIKGQSPQFAPTGFQRGNRIELFVFADGSVWSADEFDRRVNIAQATAGDDVLSGAYGADRLDGLAGNDLLQGGTGDDTYVFGRGYGADVIDDSSYSTADPDRIALKSGIGATDIQLSSIGDDVILRIAGTNDTLTIRNQLVGSTTGNSTDRIDLVTFTDEPSTSWTATELLSRLLAGSAGNDVISGTAGNDVITGQDGNDELSGRGGNDTISGGNGDDVLSGGAGADALDGGAGTDTISYADAIVVVVDRVTPSNNTGYALGDTFTNVERFVLSPYNDRFVGTAQAEYIDGGAGTDTMIGGGGDDTYVVERTADVVTEAAGGGTDTVLASATYTLSAEVERLTLTGSAAINGTGNALANILTGNAGNNTLDGAGGTDTLSGGLGDDTYVVDVTGDIVTEFSGEGNDTVRSAVAWALGNHLENLVLTGSAAVSGSGNALANTLDGSQNSASNALAGGAGDDTYIVGTGDLITEGAGLGNDTVRSAIAVTLASNVENLVLTGVAAVAGSGNALANTLDGSQNTAANALSGGAGDDTYIVGAGDTVTEAAGGGTDSVRSTVTFTLGAEVEHLVLLGTAAINGTGNALANTLTGNAANNRLSGGAGADTMIGGAGSDTYVVDSTGDVVTELASEGIDTIESSITIASLAANVENVTLTGSSVLNATGNGLDNVLTGNSANNTLVGGAGNDTLNGGAGNDTMQGGTGADIYVVNVATDIVTELANEGIDTVQSSVTLTLAGNVENLSLTGSGAINATGNSLANAIVGNSANNLINGGLGLDTLTGGLGNDTFVFNAVLGTTNVDTITDFSVPADTMQLENTGTGLFTALTATGTLASTAFAIGTAATTTSHRIIYNTGTGDLWYDADGTGATAAIRFATLQTGLALTNADFVVI